MVLYYSFGGSTRVCAEILSELLHEQLFELREKTPRAGMLGMARGAVESVFSMPVALEELPELPAGKPVFICSPIWAGNLSPAVRTFLKTAELQRRKVNLILTCSSIVNRDTYKKKAIEALQARRCTPGFIEVFVCDRKIGLDQAIIRKHLKKLVLNVDEAY